MKTALISAAAVVALSACSPSDTGANANDPATANLTMESEPGAVDPAVNQTDSQSGVSNTVDATTNEVRH